MFVKRPLIMIILILAVAIFPFFSYAADSASDSICDFRNVNWGMTKDQVKAIEKIHLKSESAEGLYYGNIILAGKSGSLMYLFSEGQLRNAFYTFGLKHQNPDDYWADWTDLRNLLIQKYGYPKEERITWRDNAYLNMPEKYGLAIRSGMADFISRWEIPQTVITLLSGKKGDAVNITIQYASKESGATNF